MDFDVFEGKIGLDDGIVGSLRRFSINLGFLVNFSQFYWQKLLKIDLEYGKVGLF